MISDPHRLPEISKTIAMAARAFSEGKANEGQQRALYEWLLLEACGIRNLSYQKSDDRATALAEGRRMVGLILAGAAQARPSSPAKVVRAKSRGNEAEATK
jgi:hypothetical protein